MQAQRPATSAQRGSALVEFTWLALLLMIPVVWLVLAVFDVQRSSFALTNAARAAGRAYALADSDAAGEAAARTAIRVAFADQGDAARAIGLTVTCRPRPQACHSASSVVTLRLSTSVGLPWLPASLGLGDPTFALDARHTVPIGRYQESADAG